MNFSEWKQLAEQDQRRLCQQLNPYEEWEVFKSVEKEFVSIHGAQPGIAKVFCGIGGTVGPLNAICVTIKKGQKRTKLPKEFMGFPVEKSYESESN